jgi:WD40 repeat protein
MGCASSNSAQNPNGGFADDATFKAEENIRRVKFDKSSGQAVVVTAPSNKPESNFFDATDAGHGEQFMAVRPYLGAIVEPANHPPNNPNPPDTHYALEYVYGYRCADSRQNVFFNSNGQAVYMTAALGIILDINSNTQKFFGGGEVDNTAKNVANDDNAHTDDITAITISNDRNFAASGQVGSAPAAFVWDAKTGQKRQRFKLAKGARGVNAISISGDGSLVALVDNSDDHNVYVFDINTGSLKFKDKGDPGKIFDVAFTNKPGDNTFGTAGSKHIKFWYPDQMKGEKGLFQNKGELTSFACIAYDDNGVAYTGGCNSQIYVWQTRELTSTLKAHNGGFICALRFANGKLYSGGKDGNVAIINT